MQNPVSLLFGPEGNDPQIAYQSVQEAFSDLDSKNLLNTFTYSNITDEEQRRNQADDEWGSISSLGKYSYYHSRYLKRQRKKLWKIRKRNRIVNQVKTVPSETEPTEKQKAKALKKSKKEIAEQFKYRE